MFYLHFKPEQLRESIVCIVIKPGKNKRNVKERFCYLYVECSLVHILEIHERPQCHDVADKPRSLTQGHQSFTRHLDYLWMRQGKGDSMKYHISLALIQLHQSFNTYLRLWTNDSSTSSNDYMTENIICKIKIHMYFLNIK